MLQIELLWALQCIDKEINSIKKDIKTKELYNRLNSIKNRYKTIKGEYDNDARDLEVNSKAAAKLNADLKNLDCKVKESNKRMFEEGANIKVVENLQKEIDNYRARIDSIENELLGILEANDRLKMSIKYKKGELSLLKNEFESIKAEYVKNNDTNKQKIEELDSKRERVLNEIDGEMIKLYNDIACKKSNPVSRVEKGTCTECGVKLNAILYDTVKRDNSICICDNCSRILYFESMKG